MSAAPPPPVPSEVVTRLRAAGCVFAEDEAQLLVDAAGTPGDLAAMVDRRVSGLPLEQVLGWAEFCGRRVVVDPGVFVPRPRTEFLVRQAAALAIGTAPGDDLADDPRAAGRRTVVVDLCCGSGAVGAALAADMGGVEVHAVDVDPAAVSCARRNLAAVAGRVYQGDLYRPLPVALRGHVDILLAVTPYVPTEEIRLMPPEARVHEPRVALDGGADGLDVLRRVIDAAPAWLAPGGSLLTETSRSQAPAAAAAMAAAGLVARLAGSDELGGGVVIGTRVIGTSVIGTRPVLPEP